PVHHLSLRYQPHHGLHRKAQPRTRHGQRRRCGRTLSMNLALDFSFYNWDLVQNFVLKGLYFSVMLTVVATIGGIVFGTLLALMRLSGKKWLEVPATIYVNGMRSIPLVMVILWFFLLVPLLIGKPIGAEISAVVTFVAFEAA